LASADCIVSAAAARGAKTANAVAIAIAAESAVDDALDRGVQEANAANPVGSPPRPHVDHEIADRNCDRFRAPETITLRVTTSPNQRATNLNVCVSALQACGPIERGQCAAIWSAAVRCHRSRAYAFALKPD
jgi:hypothetical protein